jgi:putative tricarboxylic transport membrane protein
MNNMRMRNLIASLFLLLFCAGYAYLTANLATRAIENTTQPSFFPWVITACLTILSLSLLIQAVIPKFSQMVPKSSGIPPKRAILALVLSIIYLALLPLLGFIGANILLFSGLMYLYGERKLIKNIIFSVLVSVVIFYLFREGFQIRLPAGILEGIL